LIAIEALSLVTSIHHLEHLGIAFLVPAVLAVGLPLIFMWWFLRKRSNVARWVYSATVALIILGFGIDDGLWNHTIKTVVFLLLGANKANMAGLPFPPVGSVFHEVTGVLQLAAAIFAICFGYQFMAKTRGLQLKSNNAVRQMR
jgi:hypothetical protein